MARSARPAGLLLTLTLLTSTAPAAQAACVDTSTVTRQIFETTTSSYNIKSAVSADGVSLTGEETSYELDMSLYFEVYIKAGNIFLKPKPSLVGVRDYPINKKKIGDGICHVTCGSGLGQFRVSVDVKDGPTAVPQMASASYSATVAANYPVNTTVADIVITASDYDSTTDYPSPGNYELTFSLNDSSTFSLTPATMTSTWPATYTTRLMLTKALGQPTTHHLNVTATDPANWKASTVVNITVLDVANDKLQPAFSYSGYTVAQLSPKAVGQLDVSPEGISATDQDIGGPLKYSLADLPGANWTQYFYLDPYSAELNLTEEIPVGADTPSELSFLVEAKEICGMKFVSYAMLVIHLAQEPSPPDAGGSDTGYIVAVVVLSVALVAALGATVVLFRRGRKVVVPPPTERPPPPPPDYRTAGRMGHSNGVYQNDPIYASV